MTPRAEPGSYWIKDVNGTLWPVVLISEDMVQDDSVLLGPPWRPALQLGCHRIIWTTANELHDYEQVAPLIATGWTGLLDSDLQQGFAEADAGHSLTYWRGVLASEALARALGREDDDQVHQPSDEPAVPQQSQPGNSPLVESGRDSSRDQSPAREPTPVSDSLFVPEERSPPRDRAPVAGTQNLPAAPYESDDGEDDTNDGVAPQPGEPFGPHPDLATIIIGPQHQPFVIPRSFAAPGESRYLSECVNYRFYENGERAMVLTRPAFETYDPYIFAHIAKWMREGQCLPCMTADDTFDVQLFEDFPAERTQCMRELGLVFDLAREMMIFGIFEYLFRRYRALKPWPPSELMQLVAMVTRRPDTGDDGEEKLRQDLMESVARDYIDILDSDNGGNLHDVFASNAAFAEGVFRCRNQEWVQQNPDEAEME